MKYLLIIFFLLLPSISKSETINWKIYESNTFVWGQLLGCIIRIETYTNLTMPDDMFLDSKETINSAVKLAFKNMNMHELKEKLFDMGYKNGGIDDNFLNREDFENMIVEVAQAEYNNGSSWLQSAGCLGMFRDHNFIE